MAEIVDFGLQQHKIKMDSRYFENILSVVAGDTGRRIEVQLLDTNGTVQNTTGLNLRLNALIAGKATFTDATLVDAATGKYQLDLSNGMFLAPGNWQFQWQITDSAGKKLHSFAFTGNVGSNISEGGSRATNFYLNLEDLKAMQEDLVNGTFNSEALETNIAGKLETLEETYAPRLTEVTAQLAQKVGGTVKAGLEDLSDNVLGAIDGTGGPFNLLSIPQDKSVTEKKTTFLKTGKNLFNKRNAVIGKFYSRNGGGEQSNELMAYERIDLFPNTSYSFSNANQEQIALWDKDGNWISAVDLTLENKTFTTPSNVAYGTFSVLKNDLDITQLEYGVYSTEYEPYTLLLEDSDYLRKSEELSNNVFYVGESRPVKTLKEGIELASQKMDSTLYVDAGVYDLVEEFGVAWFDNLTSASTLSGLLLKNRIHIVFSPNSKVISHYTGTNEFAQKLYSPFNSGQYGFTLENLTLECSRCRYGIHDERNGATEQYKAEYLNCNVFIDNSANDYWQSRANIGGGLGSNAEIVIDGCVWGTDLSTARDGVYYHQTNDANNTDYKSVVKIKNCYFKTGCVQIDDKRTDATADKTRYIVTNNTFLQKYAGTNDEGIFTVNLTNPNSDLYAWGNIIRT